MKEPTSATPSQDYCCPLTLEIMFDPVSASDGETYEREAIQNYIDLCKTSSSKILSPVTRVEMVDSLYPNNRTKSNISEFITSHPEYKSQIYFSKNLARQTLAAIEGANIGLLKQYLDRDVRILFQPLKEGKHLLQLSCEAGNSEFIAAVFDQIKRRNLLDSFQENFIDLLLICYEKMGAEGARELVAHFNYDTLKIASLYVTSIEKGDSKTLLILLKSKLINPNLALDQDNHTGLHFAVAYQQEDVIRILVKYGANTKLCNKAGLKPEDLAKTRGNPHLAEVIAEARRNHKQLFFKKEVKKVRQEIVIRLKEVESSKQEIFTFFGRGLKPSGYNKLRGWKFDKAVTCVLMLDEQRMATGDNDGAIRLWEIASGKCLLVIKAHQYSVGCLKLGSNTTLISSGSPHSSEGEIKIWDLRTGTLSSTINTGHYNGIQCLELLPGGRLASGAGDHFIKIWDLATGKSSQAFGGYGAKVFSLLLLKNELLVGSFENGTIRIFDVNKGKCLKEIRTDAIFNLQQLGDRNFVSCSMYGVVERRDMQSGELVTSFSLGRDRTTPVLCPLSDSRLITGGKAPHELYEWDLMKNSHTAIFDANHSILHTCMLANGNLLIVHADQHSGVNFVICEKKYKFEISQSDLVHYQSPHSDCKVS